MTAGERSEPEQSRTGSGSGERRSDAEAANSVGERSEPEQEGFVTGFDQYVGLGTVTDERGVAHLFHCVEIAGGGRTIAVGTAVRFVPRRKFGRLEAFAVTPA